MTTPAVASLRPRYTRPMSASLDRRSLLGMLLVYAALTVAVVAASRVAACRRAAPTPTAEARPVTPALRAFLGPVAPGLVVGDWTVHAVGPLRAGNLRIELRTRREERVDLTLARRDPDAPPPLATTPTLALYPATHDPTAPLAPGLAAAAGALIPALTALTADVPAELTPLRRPRRR